QRGLRSSEPTKESVSGTAAAELCCATLPTAMSAAAASAHRTATAVPVIGSGLHFGAVPAPQGVELAGAVGAFVGVGTEEVALALGEGGGQPVGAQPVVVGQRRREGRDGDAELGGGDHDASPAVDADLD